MIMIYETSLKKFGVKTAVEYVTIAMEPGHIYAMLTPSGSGKGSGVLT